MEITIEELELHGLLKVAPLPGSTLWTSYEDVAWIWYPSPSISRKYMVATARAFPSKRTPGNYSFFSIGTGDWDGTIHTSFWVGISLQYNKMAHPNQCRVWVSHPQLQCTCTTWTGRVQCWCCPPDSTKLRLSLEYAVSLDRHISYAASGFMPQIFMDQDGK